MNPHAERLHIGEYIVEVRYFPTLARITDPPMLVVHYEVTHPSPEGYARWCGMGRTRAEAEDLIERDRASRQLRLGNARYQPAESAEPRTEKEAA